MVLLMILFSGRNLFAQPLDMQAINPEFQKMDINQDSFVTPTEMQAY
mgnify:FL=1